MKRALGRATIRPAILLVTAVTAALLLAVTPAAYAQNLPAGFRFERLVGEPFIGYPVGFTYLPDGRPLVIEKETGNVRVAAVGSQVSVVFGTVGNIQGNGERGLLGIAVDPAWPVRPYLYLMGTYTDGRSRITMHAIGGDLTEPSSTNLTLGTAYVLVDYILDIYPNHKSGTLRFGPDGMLYATVGDDGDVCAVMNVDAYNGKLLRLDTSGMPGPGSGPPAMTAIAPASNPYFGSTDKARLVYAMGMRNPFRFTVDPETGNLYIADVGAHDWEEMDELVVAGHMGINYGWPFYEAGLFIARNCTPALPYTGPIYAYPHVGTDPAAIIAGPLYRRDSTSPITYPWEYDGNLFLHDHFGGWIRRLVKDGSTWSIAPPVAGQPDSLNWATNMGYISDMQNGPDGTLHVMVINGAGNVGRGLHRIARDFAADVEFGRFDLGSRAVPNPARVVQGATIRFERAVPGAARLWIFDAGGRTVRRDVPPRRGELAWNGRDDAGRPAAPGLYVYEVRGAAGVASRGKLYLVR